MDTSNGQLSSWRYSYIWRAALHTHTTCLDKILTHNYNNVPKTTTTTRARCNGKNVSTSYLFCFSRAAGKGGKGGKGSKESAAKTSERGRREEEGCESSSRYSGVTQARISSQFTSSSSTFLLVSVSIYTHTYAQVQAQACKHVCVCIDVSKDVPAELETTTTTTRAKTSFARVLFPARTLFILVHTYKSVKRVAAAALLSPPLFTTALQRYTH